MNVRLSQRFCRSARHSWSVPSGMLDALGWAQFESFLTRCESGGAPYHETLPVHPGEAAKAASLLPPLRARLAARAKGGYPPKRLMLPSLRPPTLDCGALLASLRLRITSVRPKTKSQYLVVYRLTATPGRRSIDVALEEVDGGLPGLAKRQ